MKTSAPSETVAVIIRDGPDAEWELQTWAAKYDVGINCARFTCAQEARLGNRTFETKVISEKDYDAKRLRVDGIARFKASEFRETAERPAPAPLPLTRPAPKPMPLPARPKIMIKVKQ